MRNGDLAGIKRTDCFRLLSSAPHIRLRTGEEHLYHARSHTGISPKSRSLKRTSRRQQSPHRSARSSPCASRSWGTRRISFNVSWTRFCRACEFYYAYIDDILVTSASREKHEEHLWILFERLQEYGVIVNPVKCVFGQPEVKFLRYMFGAKALDRCQNTWRPSGSCQRLQRISAGWNVQLLPECPAESRRGTGTIQSPGRQRKRKDTAARGLRQSSKHFTSQRRLWLRQPSWCILDDTLSVRAKKSLLYECTVRTNASRSTEWGLYSRRQWRGCNRSKGPQGSASKHNITVVAPNQAENTRLSRIDEDQPMIRAKKKIQLRLDEHHTYLFIYFIHAFIWYFWCYFLYILIYFFRTRITHRSKIFCNVFSFL